MKQFEAGKEYKIGAPEHGVQPTIKCISRTAKFVTLETQWGGVVKTKIQPFHKDFESANYFHHCIEAKDEV